MTNGVLAARITLALCTSRAADDVVPVLLPLPSWQVGKESPREWIKRRLREDYASDDVERLVDADRELAVADGLNELPSELHADAIGEKEKEAFDELVLFRDEFSMVRDLYQQGFELACKCLWPLVAAQNTVKRGSPDDFGDVHPEPEIVPVNRRLRNLKKFDELANAHKIAYVAQVPGWDSLAVLLNNRQRNTIGHATAHHDLQSGRVVSDKDAAGMTYLEFLGETLGVFETLSVLAPVLRASRVAASPDFVLSEQQD